MKMDKIKGFALAAFAAASYGTNPAFAVPLYEQGMNSVSVLLFRYVLGLPLIAALMAWRGIDFSIRRNELLQVGVLGVLMAVSSLTLFESYEYLNSGVASTLLFVYPVIVAVIMMLFYREKFKGSTVICLVLMAVGLYFLMKPQEGECLSGYGCLLVMLSALSYAVYIVMVNVSKTVKCIPTTRLLFYILFSGTIIYITVIAISDNLTLPPTTVSWVSLFALALIPTVISLACTTRAIQLIGSTPTAIFGALEPVSAVLLSMIVLGQALTMQDITGGLLIVVAATIVVADGPIDRAILRVRKMFPRHSRK